jgi:16S rRNA (guanine966-N2)-methyltransferase
MNVPKSRPLPTTVRPEYSIGGDNYRPAPSPTAMIFLLRIEFDLSLEASARVSRKRPPARQPPRGMPAPDPPREATGLRIIGGTLRGRKLQYAGDPRTRPMKDRVREAVFNLLGPAVKGKHVLDLFAGTGALGLEALSRGGARATFFEQHFPTAEIIRQNAKSLGLESQTDVVAANTFIQFRRSEGPAIRAPEPLAWLVFCSPPYAFYADRQPEMLQLLSTILRTAPPDSVVVVEADDRFDFDLLPDPGNWRVREYPPARVAIWHGAANLPAE